MNFEHLSIREKQAVGAFCIKSFCNKHFINHTMINELIEHLLNILKAENLIDWDNKGLNISITGRGDELPQDVVKIIPKNIYNDFYELIESSVEIGIVDLFGETTDFPNHFLKKCINILEKYKIDLDIPELLIRKKSLNNPWGEIWNINDYNIVINKITE